MSFSPTFQVGLDKSFTQVSQYSNTILTGYVSSILNYNNIVSLSTLFLTGSSPFGGAISFSTNNTTAQYYSTITINSGTSQGQSPPGDYVFLLLGEDKQSFPVFNASYGFGPNSLANVSDNVAYSAWVRATSTNASGAIMSFASLPFSGSMPLSNPSGNLLQASDWYGTDTSWDLTQSNSCNGTMTSIAAANGFPGAFSMQITWLSGCNNDRAWLENGQQSQQFTIGHNYLISFWYRADGFVNVSDRDMTLKTIPANTGNAAPIQILYTPTPAYNPGNDYLLFGFGSGGQPGYSSYFQITQLAIQDYGQSLISSLYLSNGAVNANVNTGIPTVSGGQIADSNWHYIIAQANPSQVSLIVDYYSVYTSSVVAQGSGSATGLLAYLPFDTNTASSTPDQSGDGYTGYFEGANVNEFVPVAGVYGNALQFNNSITNAGNEHSYIKLSNFVNTYSQSDTSQFTIAFWTYLTSYPTDIFSTGGNDYIRFIPSSGTGFDIRVANNINSASTGYTGPYNVTVQNPNLYTNTLVAPTSLNLNQWNHIVISFNQKATAIYYNGISVASGTISISGTGASGDFWAYYAQSGGYGQTSIWPTFYGDDFQYYGYALSSSQVAALYSGTSQISIGVSTISGNNYANPSMSIANALLYNGTLGNYTLFRDYTKPLEPDNYSLVSRWLMNEGAGQVLHDTIDSASLTASPTSAIWSNYQYIQPYARTAEFIVRVIPSSPNSFSMTITDISGNTTNHLPFFPNLTSYFSLHVTPISPASAYPNTVSGSLMVTNASGFFTISPTSFVLNAGWNATVYTVSVTPTTNVPKLPFLLQIQAID